MRAESVFRVPQATLFAVAFAFGVLPAPADGSSAQPTMDGPSVELSSGVLACESTFHDGLPEGLGCMWGWALNRLLLDATAGLAITRGRALFGEHFRIVNSMVYSPSEGTLSGGLDVVMPLAPSTLSVTGPPETGAFFLQQGVTRWVDVHGSERSDFRFGAVRRFGLSDESAASGILGVSAFVQQSLEIRHTRVVAGSDYAGKWGRGSLNLFVPTTGWRPADRGYEERALGGMELDLRLHLTTTLSLGSSIGQWEDEDGLGGWSTNGRVTLGWRPHPWLNIGVAWDGLGALNDGKAIRVGFSMPLGKTRKAPQWEGLGLVSDRPKPSGLDPWTPVVNIGAIQVAQRESGSDYLVSGATVRFLQDSASTGDRIGLDVVLPAETPRDLNLIVTLEPGTGENPAVPGVDFVDEPIPVIIRAGTSSTVVTVQLPLNAQLDEARSLRATVTRAS